jgi:hypothetical protein
VALGLCLILNSSSSCSFYGKRVPTSSYLSTPHVPMESRIADAGSKGVNLFDDAKGRLLARPQAQISKSGAQATRRKGQAAEDLGSSFTKGGAFSDKGKAKANGTRSKIHSSQGHGSMDSDSDDELDLLSSSQAGSGSDTGTPVRKKPKRKSKQLELEQEDGFMDNGKLHRYDPKFPVSKLKALQDLHFKKYKKSTNDASDPTPSNTSSSTLLILQDHRTNRDLLADSFNINTTRPKTNTQSSLGHARNPVPRSTYNRSPSPDRHMPSAHSSKPTEVRTTTENTRPKPRPLGRVASTQHKPPDIGLGSDVPRSPARQHTISESRPFPLLLPESENIDPAKTRRSPPVQKLALAEFPPLSPVASPARLSEWTSRAPQEKRGQVKKPSSQYPNRKGTITQVSPTTPKATTGKKVKDASAFPVLSPLSSLPVSANEETPGKSKLRQKDCLGYRRESEDHDSDIEELQSSSDLPKAQPFPMSTQVLNSIGSPDTTPTAGPSRRGKRSSPDGSDNEQKRKRTRKDKEDGNM